MFKIQFGEHNVLRIIRKGLSNVGNSNLFFLSKNKNRVFYIGLKKSKFRDSGLKFLVCSGPPPPPGGPDMAKSSKIPKFSAAFGRKNFDVRNKLIMNQL